MSTLCIVPELTPPILEKYGIFRVYLHYMTSKVRFMELTDLHVEVGPVNFLVARVLPFGA